jgi:hypothetical protein
MRQRIRIGLVLLTLVVLVAPGANVASARVKERTLMAEFSLQALHDEIENDPLGLGYKNGDGTWKEDAVIVSLINAANYKIDKTSVQMEAVRALVYYEAYNNLLADAQEWLRWMTPNSGEFQVTADMKLQLTGRTPAADHASGGWGSRDRSRRGQSVGRSR